MTQLREGLPALPAWMRKLPLDHRGYPVPWFVAFVNGTPDFRVADLKKLVLAVRNRRCWVCGEPLGKYMTFVVGPMCAINRTTAEPASHHECAEFSVMACPFLSLPETARREANLPKIAPPPGIPILRNPGVSLLWTTDHYKPFLDAKGSVLFELSNPTRPLEFYSQSREATPEEILESINSGLPIMRQIAKLESPDAEKELERYIEIGMRLISRS